MITDKKICGENITLKKLKQDGVLDSLPGI
jgi:hypothetical protein